jgi:hypothetical protein
MSFEGVRKGALFIWCDMADRQHPSGRPINDDPPERKLGFRRYVREGFLSPGLRPGNERTEAIGFHVGLGPDGDED